MKPNNLTDKELAQLKEIKNLWDKEQINYNVYLALRKTILNPEMGTTCFKCGASCKKEEMHYWYHGDQDDLVCETCARELKHTDTDMRGMGVLR